MPLDTRRTPQQFRREIRPSRAASAWRRKPPCLNPSALPLAQRYHARPPAALLQMQSPHGGAVSTLRKTIFSDRKSTRSHSQISYAVFCLKNKNNKKIGRAHV